ncbi:MAG: carbohydrate ABC transporter permease [Rubrobacteraceae bacterium]|uniref:carbohydrate ABC transporter permease n=1 Tax=Rubrobacter naiadicus TaxID=1392641 RepID=UPI00235DE23A|nr:carbohydrate ABC transporter permease [Rubrobacter naiadicus]MBX6762277.1 carbohydrate ABC transporter permease [Rubrobacteraceae bacterium]MCL6436968.1 carbohydrate ABC transporter permease [Rubrobacteraceae bacterium]
MEAEAPRGLARVSQKGPVPGRRGRAGTIVTYAVLSVLAAAWLLPIAWAIDTALKPESETTKTPITWASSHFNLNSFRQVIEAGDILRWYANSALVSIVVTVFVVLLASLAAYALSRIPFRGRTVLFWVVLAGLMVPPQVLIVPLFSEMQAVGFVNTYQGIILPQLPSALAVFILKVFFDGIPRELEESALVDGASRLRIYWQIWMPLARPALAAVAIFTFVGSWNYFIWPLIVVTSTDMMTIPLGLSTVQSAFGIHYAQIMASAVLGGLPLLVAFIFFQRQIVEGIANTGLKG